MPKKKFKLTKIQKANVKAHAAWMRKMIKKNPDFTLRVFADETGNSKSTCEKWAYRGAIPRGRYAESIREKFADHPLVA